MENMDVYNPDLFTYGGLRALDNILRGKSYISGEEMTKDDAEVYSLFSGIKPGSEAHPNLSRWYQAVEDKLISSYLGKDCGQAASVESAAQAKEFTAEVPRMNVHTVEGLIDLDDKLCGKSYISGEEMTKDDVEVYALFGGERPNDKYYPNARRWHRAVSEKLALSMLGKDGYGGQVAADVKRMLKEKVAEENCGMPDRSRKRKREEDTEEEEKVAKARKEAANDMEEEKKVAEDREAADHMEEEEKERKEAADDTEEEKKVDEEREAADDMEEEEKVDEEREAAEDMEKIDEGIWQQFFKTNTTPPPSPLTDDKKTKQLAMVSVNMKIPWTFDKKRSERYKKEIREYVSNLDIDDLLCAECEFYSFGGDKLELIIRLTIEVDDIYKDADAVYVVEHEVSTLMDPWKYPLPPLY